MKIDLYNNHEQYIKEQRQDWNIGRWLRSHGVTVKDLDTHRQISDVVLLINIRQSLWTWMTAGEQASWGAYWNVVYRKQKPLKPKALKKFEQITESVRQRQIKIQIIKQIGSAKQNIGHDNKAKGPCLPPVTDAKREPQECRAVPERVWEAHELWW
jgi:hypothetical protein